MLIADFRRVPESDPELVRQVQAGSTEAFSELFRRHHRAVHRACLRRLGDRVDADEVAQAAFVRALERIDQCGGQRQFGPWVRMIAHRLCLDWIRARSRTQPEDAPVGDERPSPGAGGGNPEAALLRREEVRHVREALTHLNSRQRQAVLARAVEERGPQEIAASLGLTVGAVDSLLLRGRRRLAAAYSRVAGEGAPSP